jgi:hypothetical protein
MRKVLIAALCATLSVSAASAQSDPNATCADYMRLVAQMGPTPKTGDAATDKMAAEMDQKMADYCKANPTAKISDAMDKAMQ